MHPNLLLHEYLRFERQQQRQLEMTELWMVAGLPRHHSSVVRRLA